MHIGQIRLCIVHILAPTALSYKSKELYMKRISILLITLLIAVSTISAAPIFQIGGIASYHAPMKDISAKDALVPSNFGIGADMRISYGIISLDIPATYSLGDGKNAFDIMPTVNVNIPISGVVDIAAGAGLGWNFTNKDGIWTMNGSENFMGLDFFRESKLVYRLAFTVNIGHVSIGAAYLLPTKGNIKDINLAFDCDFSKAHLQLAVLYNI